MKFVLSRLMYILSSCVNKPFNEKEDYFWKEIDNKNKNVSATSARYYNHGVDWADNDTAISRS